MRIRHLSAAILPLLLLLAATASVGSAAETTKLTISVKTHGGNPIDRAEVIVRWKANPKHPRARYGRAINTTFEMRTNQEGIANVPAIPQGNILIQINAKGYQTFGKVFNINDDEKTLDIELNPPQQQYSAH
jgi:hypothetical protein